jgi:hypothetical protein
MHGRTVFSYATRYDHNENTYLLSYSPINPQEKLMAGIISKPSKRLNLFAEFKTAQDNKTNLLVGYRARFQAGMVTGTIATNGKATTNYRKFIDMFELTINGAMDFAKPQSPATFGVSLGLGGGM